MSGVGESGAGSGGRSLQYWQNLATLRQQAASDPDTLRSFNADPDGHLTRAGIDTSMPLAPSVSPLTMHDVLSSPTGLTGTQNQPDIQPPTSKDAIFVKPQIVLPLANVVVLANAIAIVNILVNANAGANANVAANANATVNVNVNTSGPCFLAGTRILTEHGEMPVEVLKVGQRVVTLSDEGPTLVPIAWIGERALSTAAHPDPKTIIPIRIRRNAIGEGVPRRDLLVSPDHAIFIDDVLIPARLLVNGSTVAPDGSIRGIEYFHVELKRHAVLLAEGVAAESYLDTGNRGTFSNADEPLVLHPDLATTPDLKRWEADACARLAVDAPTVEPIWRRLAERAEALGHGQRQSSTTTDPDLHIVTDSGQQIMPAATDGVRVAFAVPPGTAAIRLVSRATAPSDLRPWLDDRRPLGVNVGTITALDGETPTNIAMDSPRLGAGWWAVEQNEARQWRWTDGDAAITLPPGTSRLEIELAGGHTYRVETPPGRRNAVA